MIYIDRGINIIEATNELSAIQPSIVLTTLKQQYYNSDIYNFAAKP